MKTEIQLPCMLAFFLWFDITTAFSQIKKIYTGTDAYLYDLSVFDRNIVISGTYDFMVKSYDGCANLTPLILPSTPGIITRLYRPDTNNMYLLAYNPSQTFSYKSTDGGNNWILKSTTSGAFSHDFIFFDSSEGLMTDGPFLWKTMDEGSSWTTTFSPHSVGTTAIKRYKDSLICLGGFSSSSGGFVFSKNRGKTWPYGWGGPGIIEMTDFFFLNEDTIFGISKGGAFVKTTDGGTNWNDFSEPPISNSFGVYFKNFKEGYVVGNNLQNEGIILKTADMGETWTTFNTGIKCSLKNIALIDDSIAIVTGSDGVLLRWNYANTVFTGMGERSLETERISVFPNPVQDKLRLEFYETSIQTIAKIRFYNSVGILSHSQDNFDLKKMRLIFPL
jgi:hypothetical protein